MFLFDQDNLEPFDIVLVRFPDDETSLKIREACNSQFSHAIIHLGNGSFIEGVEPTVSLFSFHRYYFTDLENVRVLRLKNELKSTLNNDEAEKTLRGLAYCNYSNRLLFHMSKRTISDTIIQNFTKNKIWQEGVVCTSLITLPYYAGGIDISNKDEPYYTHFGEIESYHGFQDVTNTVFKEISNAKLNKETYDYFTTAKTGSGLEKQAEIASQLNTYVQAKYRDIRKNPEQYSDINIEDENMGFSTWEDIFPNLMRWYLTPTGKTIDNEIYDIILNSGYHLLWFEEVHKHKEQYFPVYYESFRKFDKKDLEFLKNTIERTYERIQINEDNTFRNFSSCPCRTFHILLDMHRSFAYLLRSSINQYNALFEHYGVLVNKSKTQ